MVLELVQQLNDFAKANHLSRVDLAQRLGVPVSTLKHWFLRGEYRTDPTPTVQEQIRTLVGSPRPTPLGKPQERSAARPPRAQDSVEIEPRHRIEKIRMLLILLEDELRWFQPDGRQAERAELRDRLSAFDIGYISSLLAMLTEEEKYQRWKALTSYRFKGFRR